MDTKFIRDRITQLRIQKGVSEYKMSYDLGHSRSTTEEFDTLQKFICKDESLPYGQLFD